MRVFAGLTIEEVAHVLAVSKRTVDDDWRMARLVLSRELSSGASPGRPPRGRVTPELSTHPFQRDADAP